MGHNQKLGTTRSKTVNSCAHPSTAMKFSIVAALVVVLALAQGSRAAESPEVEKMRQFIEDMKNQVLTSTQTLMAEGQTQLEPLAASIEEQIKPLAENMQKQLSPMIESFKSQVSELIRQATEQAKAIGQQ